MHIPDGLLDTKTWVSMSLISGGILAGALRGLKRDPLLQRIPVIGMTAAFVFAAQMLNFPVAGGTSGHFMGGVFCCILLGPWTGFITMSLVLTIQCLLFQDGGLTALGANIFNMGLIGSVGGFYLYFFFRLLFWGDRTRPVAYAFASWTSVMLAAAFAAVELSISGTIKLSLGLPAMLGSHALIGLGEAFITASALAAIWRVKPEFMTMQKF
ncbi:cobalamin biosynthesis protein CbiM [candidate division LCP-89 bacterium B3_LCP]|uniref:Cobalamin biosynthesis protein CbiM n=1 Tax=candidate division LCP-89 bacterium B3_LCP TaxID=2012998 RepID=A0A532UYM0_UNCL8|nr:MAG: cobalamin biosynthesis protein CbiM [candidate division LCP-89 bacterium B3_LCP]